jgi:cell division protease FtsH
MNNNYSKNILIWIVIFVGMVFLFNATQGDSFEGRSSLTFSEFLSRLEEKTIQDVKIQGRHIEGHASDGSYFSTYATDYPELIQKLKDSGAQFEVVPPDTRVSSIVSIFFSTLPVIILVVLWLMFMKQMNGAGGKALGFGKSKAKLLTEKTNKVKFKDVAGINEAKEELSEIVDFLRDPNKFRKLGGKIPKGCLLIGPPGTGKTLLARAIAGEANVPFFSISGSDFVEMFVGVGASRVRDMFEQGKRSAPCIIFIDEIDAVGRHRGAGIGGGNDEREQTLNQMLVEMDGFESNEGVVIIAATNRPDVLDPALLRPGRFDRQITVPNPDIDGREEVLKVHLTKIKYDESVDARIIARGTPGFSGAELANLVNEAALLAARRNKKAVQMEDVEDAKDKVLMGVERRSRGMSEHEKKLTAYHEAGHAIVALHAKASDPIHKATIIPRGRALGMVMRLPESDRLSLSREKMESDIAVAMGGRVAEELIFGYDKVTSGASSDIKMATQMARAMVTEWGLSDKIGHIYYGSSGDDVYSRSKKYEASEEVLKTIDLEVKQLVENGYNFAKTILTDYKNDHEKLAKALIEHETLTGIQIKRLLEGKPYLDKDYKEDAPESSPPKEKEKKPVKKNKKEDGSSDLEE